MKITVRFDAFDLPEALTDAAIESLPAGIRDLDGPPYGLLETREDRYREALAPWIDSSRQGSATYRIEVEFDTEAGTARVLRRDGKRDPRPLGLDERTGNNFPDAGGMS